MAWRPLGFLQPGRERKLEEGLCLLLSTRGETWLLKGITAPSHGSPFLNPILRPHGEPDKYGKARFAINTLTGFNTGEMFEMKRRTRLAGLMLRVF